MSARGGLQTKRRCDEIEDSSDEELKIKPGFCGPSKAQLYRAKIARQRQRLKQPAPLFTTSRRLSISEEFIRMRQPVFETFISPDKKENLPSMPKSSISRKAPRCSSLLIRPSGKKSVRSALKIPRLSIRPENWSLEDVQFDDSEDSQDETICFSSPERELHSRPMEVQDGSDDDVPLTQVFSSGPDVEIDAHEESARNPFCEVEDEAEAAHVASRPIEESMQPPPTHDDSSALPSDLAWLLEDHLIPVHRPSAAVGTLPFMTGASIKPVAAVTTNRKRPVKKGGLVDRLEQLCRTEQSSLMMFKKYKVPSNMPQDFCAVPFVDSLIQSRQLVLEVTRVEANQCNTVCLECSNESDLQWPTFMVLLPSAVVREKGISKGAQLSIYQPLMFSVCGDIVWLMNPPCLEIFS